MKSKTRLILKKDIQTRLKSMGIDLVGFAPVERWENPSPELSQHFSEWIPPEFWPQFIYPEARTVIVIGLPVQLPIIETAPSIYYHELYETLNILLKEKAYDLSSFLTEEGYPSIYLPPDGYGDIDILLKNPLTFFSHKHAAFLAGLGSFGLNNVLLTPEFGPRVRFTSIFTTAELEGSPIRGDDLCTRCMLCSQCCPVQAIKTEYKSETDFPPLINKITCATRSKQLREEYRSPCGICIKVCPVGEDRKIFNREDTSIYTHRDSFKEYHSAWEHVRRYGSKK